MEAATSAAGFSGFEGEIETETTSASSAVLRWRFIIKRGRMRVDVGPVFHIVDGDSRMNLDLFPDSKQYSQTPFGRTIAPWIRVPKATRRGTDTILNYACDEWETDLPEKGPGTIAARERTCFAAGPAFVGLGESWQQWHGFSAAIAGGATGMPLREIITDASGAVLSTTRAVHIERKPVADAVFEIPAGYTKIAPLAMPKAPSAKP